MNEDWNGNIIPNEKCLFIVSTNILHIYCVYHQHQWNIKGTGYTYV